MEIQGTHEFYQIEEILVCEVCGNSVNKNEYEKHYKNHFKLKKVEICPYCSKQFTNISNFKYHLAHHGNDRPWLCNECPKSYKTKTDLLQHQRSHDKLRDPFQCDICREFFKTRSSFNIHMKKHTVIKGPQECQECNKMFVNLRAHIREVHERLKRYICSTCDKSFGKKSGLDRHILTVHDKIKNFSCDLCEKSFGEKIQMQRHRKIHFKEVNQKPDLIDEFMKDEEIVEDKKKYICGICKKKFNTKSTLQRHKMIVHEKKRLWLCDLCPKSYGEKSNLMRHLNKTHLKEEETIIEKLDEAEIDESYECKLCGKILATLWGLKMHERECGIRRQIKLNETYEDDYVIDNVVSEIASECFESKDENIEMSKNYLEEVENFQIEENDEDFIEALEEVDQEIRESELQGNVQINEEDPVKIISNLTCKSCNISFKSKRYLIQHSKTFHDNTTKIITCLYCNENFTHRCQRLRHVWKIHPEVFEENSSTLTAVKLNRSCEICSKVFKSEKYLQVHNSMHHKTQHFECFICSKKFSLKHSLDRHINAVHEDKRDYVCRKENCERAFRTQYELNQHFKKIHDEAKNVDPLTCDVCDKICSSRKMLYSHKKYVHEGVRWGSNIYKCKLCLEVFDTKYKKTKHWQQVHRNGELKVRICRCCNSEFQFHEDFKNHIKTHSGFLICLICGHFFTDASAFLVHEESHKQIDEDLKQFVCDVCSHRLSTKGQLEIHMRRHFDDQERFMCDICGKFYKFIAPFLHHKLTHQTTHNYQCSYCDKAFKKKRDLMLHERVHTGERPYKCQICQKDFALKQNYIKHVKAHHIKMIMCKICGTTVKSYIILRQHEETEHPEEFPLKCGCGKFFKAEIAFNSHVRKCLY